MDKLLLLKQQIGQIESSINVMEDYLSNEEFKDYCDSAYTCITHIRVQIKNLQNEKSN